MNIGLRTRKLIGDQMVVKQKISARAYIKIEALVERSSLAELLMSQALGEARSAANVEPTTLVEMFKVSLTGIVQNGAIGQFTVTGVEADRP